MSVPYVFVDFNDLGRDPTELHACYPEHVRGFAVLTPGQVVLLTDCEGLAVEGVVDRIYNRGRGDLVACKITGKVFLESPDWDGPES